MKYYTVAEVAKELRFSRQTILSWINKGVIKAVRGMRGYRIPEEELERLKRGE